MTGLRQIADKLETLTGELKAVRHKESEATLESLRELVALRHKAIDAFSELIGSIENGLAYGGGTGAREIVELSGAHGPDDASACVPSDADDAAPSVLSSETQGVDGVATPDLLCPDPLCEECGRAESMGHKQDCLTLWRTESRQAS